MSEATLPQETDPPPTAAKLARAVAAQRQAARPDASVWVAASAGTGKTKVLIDRVLSLMLDGTEPSRILCLTFTKAAAAEMSNRLAERLAAWTADADEKLEAEVASLIGQAPDPETLATARRLFARVLDAPGGMKIQTIHAFCQSLLGRFPLEAGVAPHFQVLDERSAAEMLAAARDEVLSRSDRPDAARLTAAVAAVTAHAQEQGFDALMGEVTKERGRIGRLLARHGGVEGIRRALARRLAVAPDATREFLLAEAVSDEALDLMGLRLAVSGLAQGGKTDQARAAAIAAWLEAPQRRAAGFQDYLAVFFTAGGEGPVFKTLVHKQALAAAPGADRILAAEAERLEAVRAQLRALTVLDATAALLTIGAAILEAYERHKQARALLDYDDLILKTRDLLRPPGAPQWVLYKLDGGLDHVLIDEAQDTSPEQWEVIAALSGEFFVGEGRRDYPRTVFAVGDTKQSIYGFQRADPKAFAVMREAFTEKASAARQRMDAVELDVSFRSTAAVLSAVDAVFAGAVAQDGLMLEDGTLSHDPLRVGQAGRVELWPTLDPLETEAPAPWAPPPVRDLHDEGAGGGPAAIEAPPLTRLARLIARKIWHWTRDPAGAADPEARLASKDRRLEPGDIMVLVRRRNRFVEELVRALKQLEVPVAGVDRMVLSDQLVVMDLVALGRTLLLPEDDLTLACVLKGPLIGFTEEQLFDLARDRDASLWQALRSQAGTRPECTRARDMLAGLQARADYLRPYELYAELLGAGGGRKRLLARLGPDANDPIDEFLSLALAYEREHVPALEGFLHWLESGRQEVKRDLEHGQDAVRVMTVHGAKGLQAPVVFLPDSLQTPPAERGLLWLEGDDEARRLALWPLRQAYDGAVTAEARAAARHAQAQEYRRLLYVAMTRAEDRLYVAGWNTRKEAPEDSWYRLVEAAMPAIEGSETVAFDFAETGNGGGASGWRLEQRQTAAPEKRGPTATPFEPLALPAWAQSPVSPEPAPPRPLAPSRPVADEPPVDSPLGPGGAARFQRGLIVHRLLQSLPDLPAGRRREAGARYLARPLLSLAAEEQAEILEETLAVIEAPAHRHLFGPDSRPEVPLVGLLEAESAGHQAPAVVSGQLDRLVITDQEILVVDYKTNRAPPLEEADVPVLYKRQMALYRSVLTRIFPERAVSCWLLWTRGPRLMQLSDAALEQHTS